MNNALKMVINLQGLDSVLTKADDSATVNVKIAKSNRSRLLEATNDITYEGNEFVVDSDSLGTFVPERGDQVDFSNLGSFIVTEVIEQIFLGAIIGYRLRCN